MTRLVAEKKAVLCGSLVKWLGRAGLYELKH